MLHARPLLRLLLHVTSTLRGWAARQPTTGSAHGVGPAAGPLLYTRLPTCGQLQRPCPPPSLCKIVPYTRCRTHTLAHPVLCAGPRVALLHFFAVLDGFDGCTAHGAALKLRLPGRGLRFEAPGMVQAGSFAQSGWTGHMPAQRRREGLLPTCAATQIVHRRPCGSISPASKRPHLLCRPQPGLPVLLGVWCLVPAVGVTHGSVWTAGQAPAHSPSTQHT